MSRAAEQLPEMTANRDTTEDTGRFAIDANARGSATMLPPAQDTGAEVLTLEDLGGTLIDAKPRTQPPPPPASAVAPISGVFRKDADPDAAFAEKLISLRPIYTPAESAQTERAVLEVEDLSLRPDNPYLASSLVPPTRPAIGVSPWSLVAAVAALGVVAGGAWLLSPKAVEPVSAPVQRAHLAHPRPAAIEAAPAAAPESAVAAPLAAAAEVTPAPAAVQPAPVAVAPAPAPKPASAPAETAVAASAAETAPVAAPAAAAPVQAEAPTAVPPAVPAPVATSEALPPVPSREQVVAGFESVRAALDQCAAGQHGVARISVTIAGTGRISYALVDGQFAGTPEGSCMARAVRQAQFPRFSQPSIKVAYPVAF